MNIAVVVPTYNERENILSLRQALKGAISEPFSLIVVDDSSPDGTAKALAALQDPHLILISRDEKLGIGSAYQAGFAAALEKGANVIVQMDADFSHDPSQVQQLLSQMKDADLVIGSRYIPGGKIVGWGLWRHACSRGAMVFARSMLKLRTRDVTSGYRVWNGQLLREVLTHSVTSSGYAFQEEMLFRAQQKGARIVEVPIVFKDRERGSSKLGLGDILEFFRVMVYLRKQR